MNLTAHSFTTKNTGDQYAATEINATNNRLKTTIESLNAYTADDIPEKSSSPANKYFTDARAIAAPLTGLAAPTPQSVAINASDTVIGALKKLFDNISYLFSIKANVTPLTFTSGMGLTFTGDAVAGTTALPIDTNITGSTGNAVVGVTVLVIHNAGTAPTFDSKFKKLTGSGNYVTGQLNYIYCQYINSTTIIYSINQVAV